MNKTELENFAENALGRFVGMSHFSMQRNFARELKRRGIELTIDQCRVLFTLFFQDGRTQQEISQLLLQEKSSTSRFVDSLERKGYVKRVQDMQDERQKRVFLTKEGLSLQETCTEAAVLVQNSLKEHFSNEEWEQLIHLVRKLAHVSRNL